MSAKTQLHQRDYQKFNPFRTPGWRFDRVLKLCDPYPASRRCSARDDRYVRAARAFTLKYRQCEDDQDRYRLFRENPGLYYAFEINQRAEEEPEAALIVQARLLARQKADEIAGLLGTLPEAVEWYEALFFHVTDRLDRRDWVATQVILPAVMRSHANLSGAGAGEGFAENVRRAARGIVHEVTPFAAPFMDVTLKLFAYYGGPFALEALITGFESGAPVASPEALPSWFQTNWKNVIKRRALQAALQFEFNRYNFVDLFHVNAKILEIETSEAAQGQNRTTIEANIKTMLDDIPWAVGDAGADVVSGTELAMYDDSNVELRDDELQRVSAGDAPEGLRDVIPLQLPPPRPRKAAPPGPDF